MRNILEYVQALEPLKTRRTLLAFDYDGTLAPIVDRPAHARMRSETRALLSQLTQLYPCAVVSGRAQDDVLRRVRGIGVIEAIGNHGIEPTHRTDEYAAAVARWASALTSTLKGHDGAIVENKIFSLAVHFRGAADKEIVRKKTLEAAKVLGGIRIVTGKEVLNLVPEGSPHKGTALVLAQRRFACESALYIGDDETDEDVFGLDESVRPLSIRVGVSERSRAAFFLPAQSDIERLLERLIELRRVVVPSSADVTSE